MTLAPLFLRNVAAAAAATLSFALPAYADGASRPFQASFATHETLAPNPGACSAAFPFLQGTTAGTGVASHLGKTQLLATDCIHLGAPTTFTNGVLTLTAANGDTVTAEYSGTFAQTPSSSEATISGNYRITGGTGRFAGATGAGYLTGSENLVTGIGTMQAAGTIAY